MESTTQTDSEIRITDKAAKEILELRDSNEIPVSRKLRIGVKGGGCSGLSYSLGFDEVLHESDVVLEQKGVVLVIDPKSLFYLKGVELDFSDGLNGRGFVFNNPNAARICGCGSSSGV